MRLPSEEPNLGPWGTLPASAVAGMMLEHRPANRPLVMAIDGRSGSGKSTLADALVNAATALGEEPVLVHTDDVAWGYSSFGWDQLLADHVLKPLHRGLPVRWGPPAHTEHGRGQPIDVPLTSSLLVIEGVGAARRSLAPLLDITAWVQSDPAVNHVRGIPRDCRLHHRTREEAEAIWHRWMADETPHLSADRPWDRADLVVAGTDVGLDHGPEELVVAVRSRLLCRGEPKPE